MGKKGKVEEPQYYRSKMNNLMINYNTYHMSIVEKIVYSLISMIAGGVIGFIFYGNLFMNNGEPTLATRISNIIIFGGAGLTATKIFIPMMKDYLKEKQKNQLKIQFRDMLDSLATSFTSGDNANSSFNNAYEDMKTQYSEDSFIVKELQEIVVGIRNNISIEESLNDFANRSGLEDIKNFANVFSVVYKKGGDIRSVVRNCYNLIGDKIEIENEIKTKITSNKTQQKVMSVAPILIVGFLKLSSSAFAENFATVKGVIVITIAIGIFIGAYKYGEKITDIKG